MCGVAILFQLYMISCEQWAEEFRLWSQIYILHCIISHMSGKVLAPQLNCGQYHQHISVALLMTRVDVWVILTTNSKPHPAKSSFQALPLLSGRASRLRLLPGKARLLRTGLEVTKDGWGLGVVMALPCCGYGSYHHFLLMCYSSNETRPTGFVRIMGSPKTYPLERRPGGAYSSTFSTTTTER